MEKTAAEVGVKIVAGDTKVAQKGAVDGVFIITTGVGQIMEGANTSGSFAKPGDKVIVSGDVGRHGCTILLARNEFGIEADVTSDCAPLYGAVKAMYEVTDDIHVIRLMLQLFLFRKRFAEFVECSDLSHSTWRARVVS